jgi:predicted membrane metal-binding protein
MYNKIMLHPLVYLFILLGASFAALHALAVWGSLYYLIWWFDILMHSLGGVLITLGLFAIGTFSHWRRSPKFGEVLAILLIAVVTWELFEQSYGLYNPVGYVIDTTQDMILGISFGLLAYGILKKIVKIS